MKILNSNTLRFIACVFMLMDHMWATILPGNNWLTYIGRLAFPIFAFQLVEGYLHTSDFKKYALRLLIFGLISEVPFNLVFSSSAFFPFHQNVMFTLLLGLLSIDSLEKCRRNPAAKVIIPNTLKLVLCFLLSVVGFVDYSAAGILTVILFYVFRDFKGAWVFQLIGMIFLNFYVLGSYTIPISVGSFQWFFPTQGFAVFALLLIWLYNGKKGKSSKAIQYGFYAFYPVHLSVLAAIRWFW